tara:strand:+ start:156 stop:512 length:357 start_codon:yes stop_codon:yes gene_type:complete
MNIPKIDKRIIMGYSNLLFLISIKYFFDIAKIKKDEISIKHFKKVEKSSIIILLSNIFILSKFLLKMINNRKIIIRLDNLYTMLKLAFIKTPIINKENIETDKKISAAIYFSSIILLF